MSKMTESGLDNRFGQALQQALHQILRIGRLANARTVLAENTEQATCGGSGARSCLREHGLHHMQRVSCSAATTSKINRVGLHVRDRLPSSNGPSRNSCLLGQF